MSIIGNEIKDNIEKIYEETILKEEAMDPVPFKLKFPANLEDIDFKFLYLGTQNAALNLFNKMADDRGLSAPITVQILEDWQLADKQLKAIMHGATDLKGMEAIKAWWNICRHFYTLDMPFVRKLVKKYKEVYEVLRWSR